MRTKLAYAFSIFLTASILTSCMASHSGILLNQTNVQLSQNNFTYVATNQSGEASVTYIFGIGGMSKKSLTYEAVKDLRDKRKLEDGQVWVNQTISFKTSVKLGIIVTTTCVVTGDIIQFK